MVIVKLAPRSIHLMTDFGYRFVLLLYGWRGLYLLSYGRLGPASGDLKAKDGNLNIF
jgi:hypothetical protein